VLTEPELRALAAWLRERREAHGINVLSYKLLQRGDLIERDEQLFVELKAIGENSEKRA
jgi:hypothetical protein